MNLLLFKKWIKPHSIFITMLIWLFILLLDFIRLNLHFMDPFNNGLQDYEVTDIVSSRFRDTDSDPFVEEIVLINSGKPDRKELAMLLDRLSTYNPKVIGIDILLDGRKDPAIDTLLANSIKQNPALVLAERLGTYNKSLEIFEAPFGCDPLFKQNASTGYVNFVSKDNMTVRQFSPKVNTKSGQEAAFALKILELGVPLAAEQYWKRDKKMERIDYTGNINSFIKFDIDQVTDTSADLSYAFKDKIVLVGYLGNDEWSMPVKDRFFTPLNPNYTGKSLPDMFGLVIHANIISMILNKNYIIESPKWLTRILEIFFCYINIIFIHALYRSFPEPFHGITRAIQIIEFILVFLLISILFHYFKFRIEFSTGILTLVLAYDFVMIYESLIKKRIRFLQKID